jgi:hypothetical protein
VTPPYCCPIQCLLCNLAMHGTERSKGKGGEARRGSASLLSLNRVPRGFCGFNSYRIGETCHNTYSLNFLVDDFSVLLNFIFLRTS